MTVEQSSNAIPEWLQGYNPEAERESDFSFIGRLKRNEFRLSSPEYNEKARLAEPIWQWQMEYEALDWQHDDGTPGVFTTSLNLRTSDGRLMQGPGTPNYAVSSAFSGLGVSISPQLGGQDFVGHVFRMVSHTVKMGKFSKRTYIPVEYLGGADYVFAGTKQTLKRRERDEGMSARATIAEAVRQAAETDLVKAARLVNILNGVPLTEAAATVAQADSSLRVQSIFGTNVAIGLRPPNYELITALVERSFVSVEDGTIYVGPAAPVGS